MANLNTPFGFKPWQHIAGGTPGRIGSYNIASGLGSNIFTGDLVVITGTGLNITVATVATGRILGSFAGCRYADSMGEIKFALYWPTGTVATGLQYGDSPEALVHDDPKQTFLAQVDDTAGLVAADVGQTADFVAGAGDTNTGISGHQVDQSSLSTSQQLRVLRLAPQPDNAYGQYAKALVEIINHVYQAGNTGI